MTLERSKEWWLARARRNAAAEAILAEADSHDENMDPPDKDLNHIGEGMSSIYAARLSHGAWIALDPDSPNQCGVGSTEQEAIDDLMEKIAGVRDISNERE